MIQPSENDRFLNLVTLTGADDSVRHGDLLSLAKEFPYVEFGILLDPSLQGQSGHPSEFWLFGIRKLADLGVRFAGHIDGRWAGDILEGRWSIFEGRPWLSGCFSRLQINPGRRDDIGHLVWPFGRKKELIVQGDAKTEEMLRHIRAQSVSAAVLYRREDSSPWPPSDHYAGYAGGLGSDNVADELPRILRGASSAWICAGASLRRDGKFSVAKCACFLEDARPWVHMPWPFGE